MDCRQWRRCHLTKSEFNILIEDSAFYRGSGIALGSIGQYDDTFETIQNVTCRNITSHRTKYGAYIKTSVASVRSIG